MSSFKLKKLTKQLSVPVYITIVTFLIVMTYRITKVSMDSKFEALQQRTESERVVYEQRIASLVERLAVVPVDPDYFDKRYDQSTELDELLARVRVAWIETGKLNNLIYGKLLRLYPESGAKVLLDELQSENGDWAYRFMLDYVTDEHLGWTCSLTLRNLASNADEVQLRERCKHLLEHFEEVGQ